MQSTTHCLTLSKTQCVPINYKIIYLIMRESLMSGSWEQEMKIKLVTGLDCFILMNEFLEEKKPRIKQQQNEKSKSRVKNH